MSGIIGHITYAFLGLQEARKRGLPDVALIERHFPSYLAGTYLAADIMTLPGGVCPKCNGEYGYSSSRPDTCPRDGVSIQPYFLEHEGKKYLPKEILQLFYGRTHLLFGWHAEEEKHLILRKDNLPQYFNACLADADEFYAPKERVRAYTLGWIAHVVSDAMIKSVQPGLALYLLNGTYPPENRPIQDLYSFHEVGRKEFGIDWEKLLYDLAETPVEAIQGHFMRLSSVRGQLAEQFPDGWVPQQQGLLLKIMKENRRYQRIYNAEILQEMELHQGSNGLECNAELSRKANGATWQEMLRMCNESNFRAALDQIGNSIADLFQQITKSPM